MVDLWPAYPGLGSKLVESSISRVASKNRHERISRSLTQDCSELFREVDGLGLVAADWLESAFGQTGPFWSRHYRFFRQERELTVIREVFSPELEKWLGPTPRQELQLCS